MKKKKKKSKEMKNSRMVVIAKSALIVMSLKSSHVYYTISSERKDPRYFGIFVSLFLECCWFKGSLISNT